MVLPSLCSKIDYEFIDPSLLELALSHCSVGKNNNERLEFLGDAILGFVIAEELFIRFPAATEGDLSRLRAGLVQKSTLADLARELDLGPSLILGSGELKSGGPKRESILADAVEAIISAIYFDAGFKVCRAKVLHWFSSRLDSLNLDSSSKDAKTRLQEYLQAKKSNLPIYQVVEIVGKDHQQVFSVNCTITQYKDPILGQGSSRREAEQQAAENVLKKLKA